MLSLISSVIVEISVTAPQHRRTPQSWTHSKKGVDPAERARNFWVLQPDFITVLIKRSLNGVSRKNNLCSYMYFVYRGGYLFLLIRRLVVQSKHEHSYTSTRMLHWEYSPFGSKPYWINSSITGLRLGRLPRCNYTGIIGSALVWRKGFIVDNLLTKRLIIYHFTVNLEVY